MMGDMSFFEMVGDFLLGWLKLILTLLLDQLRLALSLAQLTL